MMLANTRTNTASLSLYHQQELIEVVAYSFSPCEQVSRSFTANKIYLDILFVHPHTSEAITLRTITHADMLCKPVQEIEHTVYQEIKNALSFPNGDYTC